MQRIFNRNLRYASTFLINENLSSVTWFTT